MRKGITAINHDLNNALLLEVSWEACNQVGGIYTVLRSKAFQMTSKYGGGYCVVGPYVESTAQSEFEEIVDKDDVYYKTAKKLNSIGFKCHYGHWLVQGKPKAILLDYLSIFHQLGEIKYLLWKNHDIATPDNDELLNNTIAFGYLVKIFLSELIKEKKKLTEEQKVVAHFHEWMAATAIPEIRRENLDVRLVFTTHATMLGRYLAMNDPWFYEHLPFFDWKKEAKYFNIFP